MATSKVYRTLETGMTAAQLIEELQQYPDDAVVLFCCDYGDYPGTTQALPIKTVDELDDTFETITESAYSQSGLAVESDYTDEDVEIEPMDVDVILLNYQVD